MRRLKRKKRGILRHVLKNYLPFAVILFICVALSFRSLRISNHVHENTRLPTKSEHFDDEQDVISFLEHRGYSVSKIVAKDVSNATEKAVSVGVDRKTKEVPASIQMVTKDIALRNTSVDTVPTIILTQQSLTKEAVLDIDSNTKEIPLPQIMTKQQTPLHNTSVIVTAMSTSARQATVTPSQEKDINPPPSRLRFAYSFVISGCDPDKPVYRYFIYNILIVADILRELGSKADIVAFVQLAHSSPDVILPAQDRSMLDAMNIRVKYIPKHPKQSFYRAQFEKFRILNLTEYERVLYMDTDVVPIANLDYLFELSANGALKENIVVPGTNSPSNGGFFMMKPNVTDMERLNEIVLHRHEEAKDMPYPHFDAVRGWGHTIQPPDKWKTLFKEATGKKYNASGDLWNFNAAYADQGLLYHWVKYVQKNVSILRWGGIVENWGANSMTGQAELQEELDHIPVPSNYTDLIKVQHRWKRGRPPFSHYIHMVSDFKAWQNAPKEESYNMNKTLTSFHNSNQFWFYRLKQLNVRLNLDIDFGNWAQKKKTKSPLGAKPSPSSALTAEIDLMAPVYTTDAEGKLT